MGEVVTEAVGNVLEVRGLSKRYGRVTAVDAVDLTIARGESYALIGPNGAGKSTVFAALSGRLKPDAGRVRLNGVDVTRMPPHRRCRLGLTQTFQRSFVFEGLTVGENVSLSLRRGMGRGSRLWEGARGADAVRAAAEGILEELGLRADIDKVGGALSHGARRLLEIALAFGSDATVLLLDEPMAGLSPLERRDLAAHIKDMVGKKTVVFVEHDMEAVGSLASRVGVLVSGRLVAEGALDEVRAAEQVRQAYFGSQDGASLESG